MPRSHPEHRGLVPSYFSATVWYAHDGHLPRVEPSLSSTRVHPNDFGHLVPLPVDAPGKNRQEAYDPLSPARLVSPSTFHQVPPQSGLIPPSANFLSEDS